MTKQHSRSPQREDGTIIDMELSCARCGQKLYLPLAKALEVVHTVQSNGVAILICLCGAAQMLRRKTQD